MEIEEAIEPHIGDFVAADHEERLVVEERLDFLHTARAAQQLRLVRIVKLDAEPRAVAERRDNGVGEIVRVDRDLVEAVRLEIMEQVRGVGDAGNRDERFGNELGQRIEPRRETSGQDHRLHKLTIPFRAERMPSSSSATSQTKSGSASWRRQRQGSLTKR